MSVGVATKPAIAIPVIDLSETFNGNPAAIARVASEINRACRETGFFYVAGHRISRSLIDAQFDWTKRFFDLPEEEKLALHMRNSPTGAGYEPIGAQTLGKQNSDSRDASPDLKESFYAGLELSEDHPYARAKLRSFGFNQWPAGLPGFREQMMLYDSKMRELGGHLLSLIAVSLHLPATWFEPFFELASGTLRLLKYPPQSRRTASNQIGAGEHTDWGGITLLAQDEIGGLEVRNVADEWIPATPIADTFVINLGDLMARWTNGIYNSNMHRVRNNTAASNRYSVPFFYGPNPRALIEPIPTCVDENHPRRFATCTAQEHKAEMFRRGYGYKASGL